MVTVLCAMGNMAAASGYPWLTFTLSDGSEVSAASENVTLVYSDGTLRVTGAAVEKIFELSTLKSMRFASTPAGIDQASVANGGRVRLTTMQGVSAGTYASLEEARRALPSGIYAATTDKGTFKVIF